MAKVKIIRGCVAGGKTVAPGDVVDLSPNDEILVVGAGQGELVEEAKAEAKADAPVAEEAPAPAKKQAKKKASKSPTK